MQVHEDRRRVLAPVSTPNAAVALLRQRTFRQRAPTPRQRAVPPHFRIAHPP